MKIRGNTVGTTMPRADYAQKDPKKADFIKNKPAPFVVGHEKPEGAAIWFNKKENLDDATGDAHIMAHDLNMAQHRLKGLADPVADDDAVTKGFVATELGKVSDEVTKSVEAVNKAVEEVSKVSDEVNKVTEAVETSVAEAVEKVETSVSEQMEDKVDKANVVNNFTTTEEGFVADARALRELVTPSANETYSLKSDGISVVALSVARYGKLRIVIAYVQNTITESSVIEKVHTEDIPSIAVSSLNWVAYDASTLPIKWATKCLSITADGSIYADGTIFRGMFVFSYFVK